MGKYEWVVSDRKNGVGRFKPHVLSHTDYYPFGAPMETGERTWAFVDGNTGEEEGYRYGFNGKERQTPALQDHYDFGARLLDARLGRWWSVDALHISYNELAPYNFCANNPITSYDPDGEKIRGGIRARIDLYRFRIQTARRIKEAIKLNDFQTADKLKRQLTDLQTLKDSERKYHFSRFDDLEIPDRYLKEYGVYEIEGSPGLRPKNGKVYLRYTELNTFMSMAGAITAAAIFERREVDLVEAQVRLGTSNRLFDKLDANRLWEAQSFWRLPQDEAEQSRQEWLEERLRGRDYNKLPDGPLNVESPVTCAGLGGIGLDDMNYRCTQEYIMSSQNHPYIYIDSDDKYSNRRIRSTETEPKGVSSREK